jgi:acid stress chaperone HdeA
MKRMLAAALAASAVLLGLTGCSKVEVLNKGGDTPCNEYIGQSKDEQRVTVTKFLKQQNNDQDPTAQQVDSGISAIDILCRVQQNAKTPIKNADLTGIFVPKSSE